MLSRINQYYSKIIDVYNFQQLQWEDNEIQTYILAN